MQKKHTLCTQGNLSPLDLKDGFLADLLTSYCIMHYALWGGGVLNREQRSSSHSRQGGGLEKLDRGRDRGETFFPDSGSDRDSDETFQI